jgi:hypothetical protein
MTPRDEDELESYLQRRALLRAHRSCQDELEPPPELDQIVLRKARLAIQSPRPPRPVVARGAHRRSWYMPASVAATMLVCLTVLADLGVHALRTLAPAVPEQLGVAASVASQGGDTGLTVDAPAVAQATPAVYSAASLYSRYSGGGSTPIFEVVIRSARLTARPVSDSPRSAGPASR